MQIIEVSDLGVRSAFMSLRRADSALTFRLFPMIHIGEPAFYADVARRLAPCDVSFLEGIKLRRARYLLLLARSIARNPRFGLVSQEDALDLRPLRVKAIRIDLSPDEFDRQWRSTPWHERLILSVLARSMSLYLRCLGSRELIARHLALDDLPAREDNLFADVDLAGLGKTVLKARDAELLGHIRTFESLRRHEALTVGIPYGAGHMRAVTSLLISELRYRVVEAEWATVFTFSLSRHPDLRRPRASHTCRATTPAEGRGFARRSGGRR